MVDVVFHRQAAREAVHIVDGREDVVNHDVFRHEAVFLQKNLVLQVLPAVLLQQLLQHVVAHAFFQVTGLQRVEVDKAAHVAHAVGLHPDGRPLHVYDDFKHAQAVELLGLLFRHDVSGVEQHFPRRRVGDGFRQRVPRDSLPKRQLPVELVAPHDRQVVTPRVEEQVIHERLGGLYGRRLAGAELAVDFQHGVLVGLAGVLFECRRNAGVVAEAR